MSGQIEDILQMVRDGSLSVEEAQNKLRVLPFQDIGFAKVDLHRKLRKGVAEVIYGASKTPEQIRSIVKTMVDNGEKTILVTRLKPEAAQLLQEGNFEFYYEPLSKMGIVGKKPEPSGLGYVLVATAGTSDLYVAEEAALTAEALGNKVLRLYDVGVSGLQRTLAHLDEIVGASVIIVIAGMEGALASVIGGLASCPVIAVPTSVGYGASFHGLSALLSMLNSCASGMSVVNIDNGFGAGYMAHMINHMEAKR